MQLHTAGGLQDMLVPRPLVSQATATEKRTRLADRMQLVSREVVKAAGNPIAIMVILNLLIVAVVYKDRLLLRPGKQGLPSLSGALFPTT